MPAGRLLERERPLRATAERLAAAREGRGGTLFLFGEAGLGKTSLLEEACRHAGDGLRIARGRGDPMETAIPFGMMSQVVRDLDGPEDLWMTTDPADARSAALYRTLRWLEQSASSPTLITLDDLHWADPDSLAVLGFVCRRLAELPVAVIASLRPWPADASSLAWGLVHRADATVEELLPLTEEAAVEVLSERMGGLVPLDVAGWAWRLSGGNPLLLGLAAAVLGREGTSAGTTRLPVSPVERTLVLTRFAGLSPGGRQWAEAAAVLGISFQPDLVDEVAGLERDAAGGAAEAVWRSGVVGATEEGAAEFAHPLFRQLLYEDMAPTERTRLHRRAFAALTARGMDDFAAEHAIRADMAGDERAIAVLADAGRRALRAGAPATAARRLLAAARLSGDAAAMPLPAELGEALLEAGQVAEAASITARLLETDVPPDQRIAALTMLSRAHFSLGDFATSGAALQSAVVLAEQHCPEAVVLPLCRHADGVMMTEGPAAALPLAVRAREMAQGGGQRLQAQAYAKWAMLALFCGDGSGHAVVEAQGRRLLGGSREDLVADTRAAGCGVLVPYALLGALGERFDEAEVAFRAGMDEGERAGAVTAAATFGIPYGLMLLRTRLDGALSVADRLLAIADLIPLAEPFARTMRAYALLEAGDQAQSAEEYERARAGAGAFGIWLSLLWLDHLQGVRLLREGRSTEASNLYVQVETRYHELGVGEPCIIPFGRHAAAAHARAGRKADAARVVGWLDECASRLPCRWPAAAATAGRAMIAFGRGDLAEADEAYRTALGQLDGVPLPLERVELMIEHGTMLRRDGRPRDARESLRLAVDEAESAGAGWLARRAGEELAAAGGRRRGPRDAQALTPQEQAIARLAATGASDKDIAAHLVVSVRTVRTHLEHIYAKFGIHSRRELMAMGDRLEALIGSKG